MQHIEVDADSLIIHHHLGLGDHIICNGLVRYVLKFANPSCVWLVTKNKYGNNIKAMYSDEPRIRLFPVEHDQDLYNMPFDWSKIKLMRVGFERCIESKFDLSFYESVGVPFNERWDSFFIKRNYQTEKSLIDELSLPEKFCLVHNISSVGSYDLSLNTDLPIVHVRRTNSELSMFDWMAVIERATEIHCIDSSFIHLVESMRNITDKLYYHMIKHNGIEFARKHNWKKVLY
jgi:hypothetical protein